MAVTEDQNLTDQAFEILGQIGERDNQGGLGHYVEFGRGLNDQQVLALEALIERTLQVGHFNNRLGVPKSACANEERDSDERECTIEAMLDAAELLAHRSANSSVQLVVNLLELLCASGEKELVLTVGPDIISRFAPAAIPVLLQFGWQSHVSEPFKSVLIDGIASIGAENPADRQPLQPVMEEVFRGWKLNSPELNGNLVLWAMKWQVPWVAESIEQAFSANHVDCGLCGQWETVRQELNVPGRALPMPERPIDSARSFRERLGIGAFSEVPLWNLKFEEDHQAKKAYLAKAVESFGQSSFVPAQYADSCREHVHCFLDWCMKAFKEPAECMTADLTKRLLLVIYPRFISIPARDSRAVLDSLTAFWQYCHQVHRWENAADIIQMLRKIRRAFTREMSDPKNYNHAKSMAMRAFEAGVDIKNKQALRRWLTIASPDEGDFASARNDSSETNAAAVNVSAPKSLKERKKLLKKLKRK